MTLVPRPPPPPPLPCEDDMRAAAAAEAFSIFFELPPRAREKALCVLRRFARRVRLPTLT